ncbi:hypothetical protein MRX96_007679 [Rhipicephalus microplus]
MLAFIMSGCLGAMISLVVVIALTTNGFVKAIICTVGEEAAVEDMYPPDKYCDYLFYMNVIISSGRIHAEKNSGSWNVFQKIVPKYKFVELGISFSSQNVTPADLHDASTNLDALRSQGLRHYGLLNVLGFQYNFDITLLSAKNVIKRLKLIQSGDLTAKTVLAIGCYDYDGNFQARFNDFFTDVANTFIADIYISIISTGWITSKVPCLAAPPSMITTFNPHFTGMLHSWPVVSQQTSFKKPWIVTGLSFELSVLQYVMKNNTESFLNHTVYQPCLSLNKAHRRVLCEETNFTGGPENYLRFPIIAYGVTSEDLNGSKVLALSEYNNSLAIKFKRTIMNFGGYRKRTAWLLYNVHSVGSGNQCGDRPFNVVRLFCMALKGAKDPVCQG